jgi:hypothetical protein
MHARTGFGITPDLGDGSRNAGIKVLDWAHS